MGPVGPPRRHGLAGRVRRRVLRQRVGVRGVAVVRGGRRVLITLAVAATATWALVTHPPVHSVPRGDVAVRA